MGIQGTGAMAPRRLLIVGDPALSRGLMKMVLSRLGYVVTCVITGHEALLALAHTRFALALMALHLPDLPGLTLARRLRGTPGPVGAMPIILFGDAWDPERILESCRDARLEGYLPKPISIAPPRVIHPRPASIACRQEVCIDMPAPTRHPSTSSSWARSPMATTSSSASWVRSIWRPPRSTSTRCAKRWRPGATGANPCTR